MSPAARALCHCARVGRGEAMGAEGHIRVRVRLTLIALCSKWRGQHGEIITTQTVSVNRQGARMWAPPMNTFKQWGIFITLFMRYHILVPLFIHNQHKRSTNSNCDTDIYYYGLYEQDVQLWQGWHICSNKAQVPTAMLAALWGC